MVTCTHCGLEHELTGPTCPITEESLEQPGLCGATLDRYRVERWLGGGGFGAVYRARHTVMDRRVALKVLHAQMRTKPLAVKRFFGEAKAAAAVGSPRIVQIFDAGTSPEGHAFLAMELVDGCSLRDLAEVGQIAPDRAIRIVLGVLEALAAAHGAGIVHRDVKPGNIMLGGTTPGGERSEDDVRLVDFGVSQARHTRDPADITRSGMAMGSPGYAAPEQYVSAKDADARSDIYGIAVVLYQLLAGNLPFRAESYEQMVVQVCTKDPPALASAAPKLPEGLSTIVDRGLARDPSERWQRAEDLIAALTPWVAKVKSLDSALAPAPTRISERPPREPTPPISQATPTFIEASPEHTPEPVRSAPTPAALDTQRVSAQRRSPVALWSGAVLLVAAAGAAIAIVASTTGDDAPDPGVIEAAPPAVVPTTVTDTPGVVPSATTPAPPASTDGAAAAPTAVDEPIEQATPIATMRRRANVQRRRRSAVMEAASMPAVMSAEMGMGRDFGLEDIEPFDPE